MPAFKGFLKYGALVLIVGWMFFMGILVGRGTSPVSFDTQKFQKRLADIAKNHEESNPEPKKVKLEFYDTLDKPEEHPRLVTSDPSKSPSAKKVVRKTVLQKQPQAVKATGSKSVAKNKTAPSTGTENALETGASQHSGTKAPASEKDLPIKVSLKAKTFKKENSQTTQKTKAKATAAVSKPVQKKAPPKPAPAKGKSKKPKPYTIQVASYSDFKDALSHMAGLEKKGFNAYKEIWKKDGKTWYRVRIGTFETKDQAETFLKKLNAVQIKGMIIKRKENENNNG
ncbi:MAG: SPOR domain-containing protein [Desulfobacteraceae bacterium]|nr:MAG: SPOR domain-containing protein [Desulfobacteraceae bacterium]